MQCYITSLLSGFRCRHQGFKSVIILIKTWKNMLLSNQFSFLLERDLSILVILELEIKLKLELKKTHSKQSFEDSNLFPNLKKHYLCNLAFVLVHFLILVSFWNI